MNLEIWALLEQPVSLKSC